MSVNRDDEQDVEDGTCLGALLYALDRRSGLSSVVVNTYDDDAEPR
jgi:hypothetical protein